MKNTLRLAILVLVTCGFSNLFAQPGCPAVTIANKLNDTIVIPCGATCANLTSQTFSAAQTTAYTVGSIPYNPPFAFNQGTSILVAIDDVWGNVITLPFNFCFFGVVYNQIVVGSNGVISFNLNNANGGQSWQINNGIPSTTPGDMLNTIMGPWQDIDPSNQGQIYYQISGTYPCRSFEVSWYRVPYYGDPNSALTGECPNPLFATQQIVLYETTNAIEMYIQNKEVCQDWNDGLAIQGIQNAAGTVAYTVPGRNATLWSAQNDAWRFLPSGTPNFTTVWFDGTTQIGTGSNIQVCPPASHIYRAQATYTNCDATQVVVTDEVEVVFAGLTAQIDSFNNPGCTGGATGSVYASFNSTGTAVLSYGWTPGGANQTSLTNIGGGTYIFNVANAGNCSFSDTVTLLAATPLVVVVPDSNAYSCLAGNILGSLTANVSGGDPSGGYTYVWNTNDSTQTISGKIPGTYTVTATDITGCSGTASGTITAVVAPAVFDPPVITNGTCAGSNNGSIIVSLGQSTPPNTFVWSGGLPPNDTVTGLSPGTYSVTGADVNGCSATASYQISEPSAITIGNPAITPATCVAGGSITVTATGGTGTLVYSWSNADTGTFIDSLAAGSYTLTVTDQSLCSATATYTVTSLAGVVAFGTPVITDVACNGASSGSITAVATGGTGVIGFIWSNSATGSTITGLPAGCYSVTISDVAGCTASTTYCVVEPTAIVIDSINSTQATCSVGGTLTAFATGGTGTLTFSWSNNQSGSSIDSLAAGPYILTVTDQNLCSATSSSSVTAAPGVVVFGNPIITNVNCNGDSTGSITASASGGTGTITFTWSNTLTGATISNLPAGSYSVTINDAANCSASTTYIVTEAAPLNPNLTISQVICFGATNGTACAAPTGGIPGYTYVWHTGAQTSCIAGQPGGIVVVTVTDAVNCTARAQAIITQAEALSYSRTLNLHPCQVPSYGDLSIVVRGGVGAVIVDVPGVGTDTATRVAGDSIAVFPPVPAGTYTFSLTDTLGCTTTGTFFVPQSAANDVFAVVATDASCFGAPDGTITITPGSANGPYVFSLNGGPFQTDTVFTGLAAGAYTIVARNTYGCTTDLTAEVNQPAEVLSAATADSTSCFGDINDGAITVNAPASVAGPFEYAINGGSFQTDSVFTNLAPGVYTLVTRSAAGCTNTITAEVFQPAPVSANATPDTIVTSAGVDNAITVAVQNFNNPVFTWTPAQGLSCTDCNNPTANVGADVVFYVTVSEAEQNNCAAYDSVIVIVTGGFEMPNAFTPNGDGRNDVFGPVSLGKVTIKDFRIYNRWGEMIHNALDNWDGQFGGKEQPVGTFVYYIQVELPDKDNPGQQKTERKQGSFSLIR